VEDPRRGVTLAASLWFAHGSASYRKHFPPAPARSKYPAAIPASRRCKTAWDRLRAGLEPVLDQRGAGMADIPGGASGLLARGLQGKEADRLVTRLDLRVVSW
jgi:hypothetical protein